MRLYDYGDQAVLIETDQVTTVRNRLIAAAHPAITAVLPAACSVLVEFDGERPDLTAVLSEGKAGPSTADPGEPLHIPVRYDGPDLAAVAVESGLSIDAVVELHAGGDYTVLFCGFSPGFGYLTGLDQRLRLPRLDTPRTTVPAGSVAIADQFTGVYPRPSPGGWRLLGRTDTVLFDLDRRPPALFAPGRRVRFIPQ